YVGGSPNNRRLTPAARQIIAEQMPVLTHRLETLAGRQNTPTAFGNGFFVSSSTTLKSLRDNTKNLTT
ncbi:MAG: hypothetical protein ACRCUY_00465, partial [Thermoguttaceae bacterium]